MAERAAAYLGLGSNLGDRGSNLDKAIGLLAERMCVDRVSSVYDTEPVGISDQPRFLNMVCRVIASLPPGDLLELAKNIESRLGRQPGPRNGPRPIDIDILVYDDLELSTPGLVVPHPRMSERAFVLVPLAEIAPDLRLPGGRTVRDLLRGLNEARDVRVWRAAKENDVRNPC